MRRRTRGIVGGLAFVAVAVVVLWTRAEDEADLVVSVDGQVATLSGVVRRHAVEGAMQTLPSHPSVQIVHFDQMAGSQDDEANLAFARWVREHGYDTEVGPDSWVIPGAVDLFLAGATRTGHCDAEMGVHGWWDDDGYGSADVPRDHPTATFTSAFPGTSGCRPTSIGSRSMLRRPPTCIT